MFLLFLAVVVIVVVRELLQTLARTTRRADGPPTNWKDGRRLKKIDPSIRSAEVARWTGDSPLHHAYYLGQQEVVDRLTALGADENLLNNEGLEPAEMAVVSSVQVLLSDGARWLNPWGDWLDEARGRACYDRLVQCEGRIYNPALVRAILAERNNKQLLRLAIKVGKAGSEARLVDVLNAFGTSRLATEYLNSGSSRLADAARSWAARYGYEITYDTVPLSISWGEF